MSPTLFQLLLDLTAQNVRVDFARPSLDPSTFRIRLTTFGKWSSHTEEIATPLVVLEHAPDREALIVETITNRVPKLLREFEAFEAQATARAEGKQ